MKLYLIRHGNTFAPGDKVTWVGSQNDLPLVESGIQQAQTLSSALQKQNIIPKAEQQVYIDRIKHELEVLQGANLSSYFLIIYDILEYIEKQGWMKNSGRGSVAGSMVAYLLGITQVDSIKYNLIFERFYNRGRSIGTNISLPDIDLDVEVHRRSAIIQYIKDKYGHDKVSQLATHSRMKGRSSLKDVMRAHGVSFSIVNQMTKTIPDETAIADELAQMKKDGIENPSIIMWTLENDSQGKMKEWCYLENGELKGPYAKLFEQAVRLENVVTGSGKHAAAVITSLEPLAEVCPMMLDSKTKLPIVSLSMDDSEKLGLVKFDILGLNFMDKIMGIKSILETGDIIDDR